LYDVLYCFHVPLALESSDPGWNRQISDLLAIAEQSPVTTVMLPFASIVGVYGALLPGSENGSVLEMTSRS